MLTGKTGLVKTYLSNCITNELVKREYSVFYQSASFLMDKILDYKFKNDRSEEMSDFMKEIYNSDLLIIDDLGTEATNNYRYEELFEIINKRLNEGKKMVISTNLSLQGLKE